ncbi:hypothetical protein H6G36_13210 [Anabaena minutissima FACHB-250]|nr:hypothetical protein [Anabaena minutissima FACHB-250]
MSQKNIRSQDTVAYVFTQHSQLSTNKGVNSVFTTYYPGINFNQDEGIAT